MSGYQSTDSVSGSHQHAWSRDAAAPRPHRYLGSHSYDRAFEGDLVPLSNKAESWNQTAVIHGLDRLRFEASGCTVLRNDPFTSTFQGISYCTFGHYGLLQSVRDALISV